MTIAIECLIGGESFLPMAFQVHSGTYGSVGHATIDTSIRELDLADLDLVSVATNAPGGLEVGIAVTIDSAARMKIFGGEYVSAKWSYDTDIVEIHCRDFAGVLVDQKQPLARAALGEPSVDAPGEIATGIGIETQNQTLKSFVTSVAKQYGLGVSIDSSISGANNPTLGTIFGSDDAAYTPMPTTLWAFLSELARITGNEVWVNPNKVLVFGPPGSGAGLLQLSWGVDPVPDGAAPVRDLTITHNPRRNSSFRVKVLSHDPGKAQITTGYAFVIGTNFSGSANQVIRPGIWGGAQAFSVENSLVGGKTQFPLYSFHIDGLTAAQAQARAVAIATDIAKREFILDCIADPIPGVIPMQHVRISGPIHPTFSGNDFYVNAYNHSFTMPRRGDRGGLITKLTLLDLSLSGVGSPLTAKVQTK